MSGFGEFLLFSFGKAREFLAPGRLVSMDLKIRAEKEVIRDFGEYIEIDLSKYHIYLVCWYEMGAYFAMIYITEEEDLGVVQEKLQEVFGEDAIVVPIQ